MNYRKKFLVLYILCLSSVILAEQADNDMPIEIESDSMIVDDNRSISIYKGDVILTQGTMIIRADQLTVREDKQGFQHSISVGNPTSFKQKRDGMDSFVEGKASRIEYDGHMDKVHLYDKASVKRGKDTVFGDYIIYDANAEIAQAMSGSTKNNSGKNSKKTRTRAIIIPKKDK
jgi:lipopolysaccharide export system protein LptA|tara:strand:+ start:1815 stop:2336 length:522 start_codon:yes stop_codon:yes gene_type:complete